MTRISYWTWFLRGGGDKPGYRRLANSWIIFHSAVGVFMSIFVTKSLEEAANSVLLPVIGILIGLSFAWGGSAQALMQTAELRRMFEHRPGGLGEYVYTYQTAILTLLATAVLWGLAGVGVFDRSSPVGGPRVYFAAKTSLFFMCSLALRECWHVVDGAGRMLMRRDQIRRILEKEED